jgi:hypothetical protein
MLPAMLKALKKVDVKTLDMIRLKFRAMANGETQVMRVCV